MNYTSLHGNEDGFTLIELMVSSVISLIILGGFLYSFSTQSSEYKYQNARVFANQDSQSSIDIIKKDLQKSLISLGADPLARVFVVPSTINPDSTAALSFKVWNALGSGDHRERHCYLYRAGSVYQNINFTGTCDAATSVTGFKQIENNVSLFRVLDDSIARPLCPNGNAIAGIPNRMPSTFVYTANGDKMGVNGLTIIIELNVNAGYKLGTFAGVCKASAVFAAGDQKRTDRYAQVYPANAVL